MDSNSLHAISPLDGRYQTATQDLAQYFSEAALIHQRLEIEIIYLKFLAENKIIRALSKSELIFLAKLALLDNKALARIKKIEAKTHHDIKAIEYFLQANFQQNSLKDLIPYIHFALTSEDVNNLALRLLIKKSQEKVIIPNLINLLKTLDVFIKKHKATPMLARTHGQAAIATTFGKEIAVFASRLLKQIKKLDNIKFTGKFSGAVGSYNSFVLADSKKDWRKFCANFVKSLDLAVEDCSTQINPNDDLTELFAIYQRINLILIDFSQDIWRYISDGWLIQKHAKGQIGSSTMPQKINPIDFENAEGNLGLANALLEFFMRKLPISRLQRDLSDSTVLRNIGVASAHANMAYKNLNTGLEKISLNKTKISADLNSNWNILAEAMNISSRLQGDSSAYQKAMQKMKGKKIDQALWQELTKDMNPQLANLSPTTYLGLSEKIATQVSSKINRYLAKRKNYD